MDVKFKTSFKQPDMKSVSTFCPSADVTVAPYCLASRRERAEQDKAFPHCFLMCWHLWKLNNLENEAVLDRRHLPHILVEQFMPELNVAVFHVVQTGPDCSLGLQQNRELVARCLGLAAQTALAHFLNLTAKIKTELWVNKSETLGVCEC